MFKLRNQLAIIDENRMARFTVFKNKAYELLEYSQTTFGFTTHGRSHAEAVESNYDWLLSDEDVGFFNSIEIFCLLCATYFHDAMMIPRYPGDEERARNRHASEAIVFLAENRDSYGLSKPEVLVMGEIIKGHSVDSLNQIRESIAIGNVMVRLHPLVACLSLADICHADQSRSPESVSKRLQLSPESLRHWKLHRLISGIAREGHRLIISGITYSDDGEKAIEAYAQMVRKQLETVTPYFDEIFMTLSRVEVDIHRTSIFDMGGIAIVDPRLRKIVPLFIKNIYSRNDVFIRESIQNSLEACYIRSAKKKGLAPYNPTIVITLYSEELKFPDEGIKLRAIRVDDNGKGMDYTDALETLLSIGNSISDRDDIQKLLKGIGKDMIARFGIGILSYFNVAKLLRISTYKASSEPFYLEMQTVYDFVHPKPSEDREEGTTVFIELKDEDEYQFVPKKMFDIIKGYFPAIFDVDLRCLQLEWPMNDMHMSREKIFQMARSEAEQIKPTDFGQNSHHDFFYMISSREDNFVGGLWLNSGLNELTLKRIGKIDILCEGVYVCSEDADEWLPKHLKVFSGIINFRASVLDLPLSREQVIKNEKIRKLRLEIANHSSKIIEDLCRITKHRISDNYFDRQKGKFAALTITYMFSICDQTWKDDILGSLDSYQVIKFAGKTRSVIPLSIADHIENEKIYLRISSGKFVSQVGEMDGNPLYYHDDDAAGVMATFLVQKGRLILEMDRLDLGEKSFHESYMVREYLRKHEKTVTELNPAGSSQIEEIDPDILPIPENLRPHLHPDIHFVQLDTIPTRKYVKFGSKVYINAANKVMGLLHEKIQNNELQKYDELLLNILSNLLFYSFDTAIKGLIESIGNDASPWFDNVIVTKE